MDIPSKDKHRRQDISHWNGSGGAENQGKGHLVGNTWKSYDGPMRNIAYFALAQIKLITNHFRYKHVLVQQGPCSHANLLCITTTPNNTSQRERT